MKKIIEIKHEVEYATTVCSEKCGGFNKNHYIKSIDEWPIYCNFFCKDIEMDKKGRPQRLPECIAKTSLKQNWIKEGIKGIMMKND